MKTAATGWSPHWQFLDKSHQRWIKHHCWSVIVHDVCKVWWLVAYSDFADKWAWRDWKPVQLFEYCFDVVSTTCTCHYPCKTVLDALQLVLVENLVCERTRSCRCCWCTGQTLVVCGGRLWGSWCDQTEFVMHQSLWLGWCFLANEFWLMPNIHVSDMSWLWIRELWSSQSWMLWVYATRSTHAGKLFSLLMAS